MRPSSPLRGGATTVLALLQRQVLALAPVKCWQRCAPAAGGHTFGASVISKKRSTTWKPQLNRPAVDVGPPRARPGIALVLGLLSLPGSTIAWELPLGGLWIGLPLGVAAIVLGVRARRAGVGVGMATAAIVLAGLAIAQMVVYSIVSAVS